MVHDGQRARAQQRASGSDASSPNQTAEDPNFSLVSNWNRPAGSWAEANVSKGVEKILASFGSTRPRPNSLQEQLLTPAFDRMYVVGITPPGRGTALALALVATERVEPRVRSLQVLVVEPWPPSDLEDLAFAFARPSGIGVDCCECRSNDECDHPSDGHQILVHSPTADTRTTVAEQAMRSSELSLVVLHRVDALLAVNRPKIVALLCAKPPHVQLVITTTEMTADILRIARDFMPPRLVHEDESPAVISMTKEGVQVASYSLIDGRLKSEVHLNAQQLDELPKAKNVVMAEVIVHVRNEAAESPSPAVRDSMAAVASKLKLRVGSSTFNRALQRPQIDRPNAHVLVGFGDHIHSCIQHQLLTFHSVRHFVAFHTGVKAKPESGESAFEWGVHLLQSCLPGDAQTVLVTERVTDEVLRLCNKLEGEFSLISTPEVEDGGENPTESQSRPNSQDSAGSKDFVRVEPLTSPSESTRSRS
ncbi:hypothetical protein M3Y99_01930300 [Aphelenchoides fujianensis]|nr:hypothetical protein M3Y99_01930300 [Aphelenchoides fujianensis]